MIIHCYGNRTAITQTNHPKGHTTMNENKTAESIAKNKKNEKLAGLIILLVFVIIFTLVVILQSSPDDLWTGQLDEQLIGVWKRNNIIGNANIIVTFNEDGTGSLVGFTASPDWTFDWSVNGDIIIKRYHDRVDQTYRFSIRNDVLSIRRRNSGILSDTDRYTRVVAE